MDSRWMDVRVPPLLLVGIAVFVVVLVVGSAASARREEVRWRWASSGHASGPGVRFWAIACLVLAVLVALVVAVFEAGN